MGSSISRIASFRHARSSSFLTESIIYSQLNKVRNHCRKFSLLVCILIVWSNQACSIAIEQYSAFINSSNLGANSLEDTQVGFGNNEFSGAGLAVSFTNSLDANNFGSVSWLITNNVGNELFEVRFFGFLDAEIDETLNTFFNESGEFVSISGLGAIDFAADSWEIDEPGFVFGDIFNNLLAGALDNTNAVPAGYGHLPAPGRDFCQQKHFCLSE